MLAAKPQTPWKTLLLLGSLALHGASVSACQELGEPPAQRSASSQPVPNQDPIFTRVVPDLAPTLAQVTGLKDIKELESDIKGYRVYQFSIEQPLFHDRAESERFSQQVTLLYTGSLFPTVLKMPTRGTRSQRSIDPLTQALDANQITFDSRYTDTPNSESGDVARWNTQDTVADIHALVKKLRPVLMGSWISEGREDAALTAIAHRRYHPFDTQATVAYAGAIHTDQEDTRYTKYLSSIGSEVCRKKIRAYQRALLNNKHELAEFLAQGGDDRPLTFDIYPGKELEGLERTVHFFEYFAWYFWGPELVASDCALIPDSSASPMELLNSSAFLLPLMMTCDNAVNERLGLSLQRRRELGFPNWEQKDLQDLYTFDVQDRSPLFLGRKPEPFDGSYMLDLHFWTSFAMNRTIMIYGELDPNTAAAFRLPNQRIGESYVFKAPSAGKDVDIQDLPDPEKDTTVDAIRRWTGATWTPKSDPNP